ncbi:MAG: CPBP family intramembrane metalloprotease [Planctomycetes bacterium]|nr:CPBP family intramembrane metalloprotease [Planctomycetota bacterium]
MIDPTDGQVPALRQWPQGEQLDPATAMTVDCPGCNGPWLVHPDLAGFRLRCACGAWMQMPPRQTKPVYALPFEQQVEIAPVPEQRDAQGRVELPMVRGEVSDAPMPTHVPLAPGTVQHGNVETQQRWNNAAFLELALMMTAFLLPWLLVSWLFEGQARTLVMPFTSMATGVAVVLIAAVLSPYAFTGFRAAGGRFFAEAGLGAMVMAWLATLWVGFIDIDGESSSFMLGIREALGDGWALFVIAFCPALFEELAFRGAVQGRFSALLGRNHGIIATGAAFGLCHGVTAALPFHIGLGIWFCWLRERSASLLPGMLAHALYNGILVLTA